MLQTFTKYDIPCFPLKASNDEKIGKTPAVHHWRESIAMFNPKEGNYGVCIPKGYCVLDYDSYKPQAKENWEKLWGENEIPKTFFCMSGKGGWHLWFKLPDQGPWSKQLTEYTGIDFLTNGMYVVGPGSIIAGKEYKHVSGEFSDIPELPDFIKDVFRKQEVVNSQTVTFTDEDKKQNKDRYVEFLKHSEGGVKGEGCDLYTYKIACRGRDFGLSEAETYQLMAQWWNEKCVPNWPADKLYTKVQHAYKYATAQEGKEIVSVENFDSFDDLNLELEYQEDDELLENGLKSKLFVTDGDGKIKPTINNLYTLMQIDAVRLKGLFKYDLNSHRIVLSQVPFFRPWFGTLQGDAKYLSDNDVNNVRNHIATRYNVDYSKDIMRDVISSVAQKNCFHSIRDWLENLEWDGTERVKELFGSYFGYENLSEEESYYRDNIAKGFLLASVHRIFNPGSHWKYMLTLAGPQGTGKSPFVEIIGGEYSRILYQISTDRKALQTAAGAWFIEFPELSAAKKADVDQIKAYLSAVNDTFIPMYGREPVTVARQSVPVWTINPPRGGFLKDVTGNERFLIIEANKNINLSKIEEDRDQLFAEAMVLYRKGINPISFIKNERMNVLLGVKQDEAQDLREDPWVEEIHNSLIEHPLTPYRECAHGGPLTMKIGYPEIYDRLGIHLIRDRDKKSQERIRQCMLSLGWKKIRQASGICFKKDVEEVQEEEIEI